MSPPGRAERTEQDAPPSLITFRRLTLRSATGTPQRGGPYHPGVNSYFRVRVQLNIGTWAGSGGSLPAAVTNRRLLVCRASAHGMTLPACPKVARTALKPALLIFVPHPEITPRA